MRYHKCYILYENLDDDTWQVLVDMFESLLLEILNNSTHLTNFSVTNVHFTIHIMVGIQCKGLEVYTHQTSLNIE